MENIILKVSKAWLKNMDKNSKIIKQILNAIMMKKIYGFTDGE